MERMGYVRARGTDAVGYGMVAIIAIPTNSGGRGQSQATQATQFSQTKPGMDFLSGWVIYTPHFCRIKRFSKYSIYLDGVHIVLHTCGVFEPRHAFNSILACRAMPSCILIPIARPENGSAGCSLRFPATRDW